MKILTPREMAKLDEITIKEVGLPSLVLMENASRALYEAIRRYFPDVRKVLILAGKGNNGGDGIALGRLLHLRGVETHLYLVFGEVKGDAELQLEVAKRVGLKPLGDMPDLREYDLVVDAIFGTGFSPPVRGKAAGIIELLNSSGVPVLSVDIPSGLSGDSGKLHEPSVKAILTVTFQFPKVGHVLFPSSLKCGKVVVADISIPESLAEDVRRNLLLPEDVRLYRRERDTYKTREGHLLVVGGSRGFSGAPLMCAKAATETGAGLVTVGLPGDLGSVAESVLLEEMYLPLEGDERLSYFAVKRVLEEKDRFHALCLGMGMGRYEEGQDIVLKLLREWEKPLLLDADGINNLADYGDLSPLKERSSPTVLTPHLGEFSRLTGLSTQEIKENQIELAGEFAHRYGCYLVLKGARTVIATPEGETYTSLRGTPAMAKGGVGDVLAGILGALLCKLPPLEALKLGVMLHGLAGEIAEKEKHTESLRATDLIRCIPKAYRKLEDITQESLNPPDPLSELL